jgi:hypothetical protein
MSKYVIRIDEVDLSVGRDYERAHREYGKTCGQFPRSTVRLFEDEAMIKERVAGELPTGWDQV